MKRSNHLSVAAAIYPRLVLLSAVAQQLEAGKGGLVNEVPTEQEQIPAESTGGVLISLADRRAAKAKPQKYLKAA